MFDNQQVLSTEDQQDLTNFSLLPEVGEIKKQVEAEEIKKLVAAKKAKKPYQKKRPRVVIQPNLIIKGFGRGDRACRQAFKVAKQKFMDLDSGSYIVMFV